MSFTYKDIVPGIKNVFASSEKKEVENAVIKMVNSIKNQRSLYRKEILDWKNARAAALNPENPRRKQMIDLIEDILGDAFIFGRTDTRKLRVSNKSFAIMNSKGEIDDDKTKLLQKRWFNEFMKYAVESIYFGYSLIYPKELDKEGYIKKIALVYRDHIVPEKMELLKNTFDPIGTKFNEAPYNRWLLFINYEGFLGLLDKAAPLWIYKKHSWQNWDEFEEMFGIPIRTATVASTDKRVQAEVDKWLRDLGSAAWGRFPEGVVLDIKESNSRDSFNVFNEKRKAANEELATLIDGNFETAKDTGSRAKAETIIDSTQALVTLDDEARVSFIVNDDLIPFLIELGYPFEEGDTFIWNENKKLTPTERLAIFKGVKALGWNIKKSQIETELDVELEEIVPIKEPIVDPKKKDKVPKNVNKGFNLPHAHHLGCGCGACDLTYRVIDFEMLNALSSDEEKFLRQYFENPNSINWSYKEFKKTHGKLLEALRLGFGNVDEDFESDDHLTMQLFQANIHRFGMDKTQKEILDLNDILKTSNDYSEFRERAKKLFPNYNENWLRAEYDQAWNVSRMGARYIEMMRDIAVAPFWRFVAVIDSRTTKICQKLHHLVFDKLDKNAWKFLPPIHWICRSDAEDVLASYDGQVSTFEDAIAKDVDGWERMKKSGFDVNWGDAGEVFSATQSYLIKAGVKPLNPLDFNFAVFGLNPTDRLITSELPTKKLDLNSFTDRSGFARFIDVQDTPVWLDALLFDSTDEVIRNTVNDVLTNPDELYWYTEGLKNFKSYFKFYKKETINIISEYEGKEINKIASITKVDKEDELRKGLLLYTPKEHIEERFLKYNSYSDDYKQVSFNDKNGGFVVHHKEHDKKELKNNKLTSKILENLGKSVELLPIVEGKSVDALLNDVSVEFKLLTNYKNLFGRVKEEIKRASKQSPNVLLHINNKYSYTLIIRGINAAIKNDETKRVKFLSILFNDNRLYTFSRKQIETKEFEQILKR